MSAAALAFMWFLVGVALWALFLVGCHCWFVMIAPPRRRRLP